MSRDQRVRDNHALLHAQAIAHEHNVPLYVLFVLKTLPGRSREHYLFMIDGLEEVASELAKCDIPFILRSGNWQHEVAQFARDITAGALVCDFNPLAGPRRSVKTLAAQLSIPVWVVDTHNIIPVWVTSDKQEFAAHTIRRKIHKQLEAHLVEPEALKPHSVTAPSVDSLTFSDARKFAASLPAAGISLAMDPGEQAAHSRLKEFLTSELADYANGRNDFAHDRQSGLSPYLHFGHISSLRVALETMKRVDEPPLLLRQVKMAQAGDTPSKVDGMNALFEEMIVRKELSDNFCFYNPHYHTLAGAPTWANDTLEAHARDVREFTYSKKEWEHANTHDDAWNAAQTQLARTGKLHGYMRMYWAKKLLEWSSSPETALEIGIYLNDKYSIDGGDPNGYVGLLWSIAGLHDRPWRERAVYGKIRYMNANGLARKYDLDSYNSAWKPHQP